MASAYNVQSVELNFITDFNHYYSNPHITGQRIVYQPILLPFLNLTRKTAFQEKKIKELKASGQVETIKKKLNHKKSMEEQFPYSP